MERYNTLFTELKTRGEGAFVPFVMIGDPGPAQSLRIIDTLIAAGADALELGIPFSIRWPMGRRFRMLRCGHLLPTLRRPCVLRCWRRFARNIRRSR